jgi:hypothetical protein
MKMITATATKIRSKIIRPVNAKRSEADFMHVRTESRLTHKRLTLLELLETQHDARCYEMASGMITQAIALNGFTVQADDRLFALNIDLNLTNIHRVSDGILTSINVKTNRQSFQKCICRRLCKLFTMNDSKSKFDRCTGISL